jgi:hypothetical protein
MTTPLDILIVEKMGEIKLLSIKDFKEAELYKKCGFKKAEDFNKQTEWTVKCDGTKYFVQLFAKIEGRANSENKYDFPPPIDTKLFYGSCAIIGQIKNEDGVKVYENLTVPLWDKIYEKLFGGFEDLAATAKEDDEEIDELANVPKDKKTKHGYLKDGFVVDSSDTSESATNSSELEDDELETSEENIVMEDVEDDDEEADDDIGSELSEEEYL